MNSNTWLPITALITFSLSIGAVSAQMPTEPAKSSPSAPSSAAKVWTPNEFRIVPVRVHLLRDSETRAAITTLTAKDIKRIFSKANGIWHAAGIHLWVESIVTEKPAATTGYEHAESLPTDALLALRPADTRSPRMFHVYYIGAMSPNGIFMRRDGIFVKESARLRAVAGGIDEPLPRVTAHELGHGMGLPHRQDTFNLLASGTTGTSLNDAEIGVVRTRVGNLDWVLSPASFLNQADAVKDSEMAKSMYAAIIELPGESQIKRDAAHQLEARKAQVKPR